jgi:hypothetical protein
MANYHLFKQITKGTTSIALAGVSAFFAAYAFRAFGGWAFALSFLLMVACCVPMVLFFNLFPGERDQGRKGSSYKVHTSKPDLFSDMFGTFYRDKDD